MREGTGAPSATTPGPDGPYRAADPAGPGDAEHAPAAGGADAPAGDRRTPAGGAPAPHGGEGRPEDTGAERPGAAGEKRPGETAPVRTARWAVGLALLPLALLGAAAWLGRHVRPSADEWCFLPQVRDHGIGGLVHTFYFTDNGRLANGLLVGLYAKFPVAGHQWFGLVSGVLMLVLLWAVVARSVRATGWTAPRGVPLLTASMITAVFLFATPNTYKTFYWPAASVSHTLAPVLACATLLPLATARGRRGRATALAVVVLTGVFMGTLSEEVSVIALVLLAGVVLFAGRLFAERVRGFLRVWSLAGMAGVVIGTLLLVTSPGSRNRRERYGAGTTSMLDPDSLLASARGWLQILGTVLTTWQYLGAVAAGVLLGLLARRRGGPAALLPGRGPLLLGLGAAAFLVCGYLCTVITYPVFGDRVVHTERTWNDYLLLWVLLLTAAGALAGHALRARVPGPGPLAVRVAAAAVCAVSVLGLAVPLQHLGHDMRVRAQKWDRQDAYLRQGAADGARVLPYRPVSVSGMLEPFGAHGKHVWPARCVADYYDLDRVTYGTRLP
ncbi:DUF6056 family protein [Streptomyces sp. LP05-1]|uniref:DUF6056 family protein n=1 Tax=Streptomyces pyxinae TaxID=2970734 RepID=A0ABT2CH44_9ACTN|nr:DUF6056 family protein [Streptomyces sp. LP05-1]MCS0636730.1 DUF6056 family protein [Streptomyces sp. LP05-1]